MDSASMTGLTNAERMVLVSASRGEPVSVRFVRQVQRLEAMGLVAHHRALTVAHHRVPTHQLAVFAVDLTVQGSCLARAYRAQAWGELWTELATRLQTRACYTGESAAHRRLMKHSRQAMRRAMEAAVRVSDCLARAEKAVG